MAYDPHQDEADESPYGDILKKDAQDVRASALQTSAPGLATDFGQGPPAHAEGRGATGWVNYDQLYAANEDAAKHTAKQLAGGVEKKAQDAQGAIAQQWSDFDKQVQAGTPAGPSQRDFERASGMVTDFFAPPDAQRAPGGAPMQAPAKSVDGTFTPQTEDQWLGTMKANAAKGYSGPSGLSALDDYGKLAGQVGEAADQAEALGSQGGLEALLQGQGPNTTLDAMLAGSAGRHRFHELGAQYGGLRDELDKANQNSAAAVAAAKAEAAARHSQYGSLLDAYDQRKADEAAYAAAHQTPPVVSLVGPNGESTTLGPAADTNLGDDLSAFPSDENEQRAKDQLNPETYGQKIHDSGYLMGLYKTFSGSSNDDAVQRSPGSSWEEKFHNWVESQVGPLTPAEWKNLESMTPEQQKAWFDDKKAKKGGG